MRRVAILSAGGMTHVAGGIGQLMGYVAGAWAATPGAPIPISIDTRGPGGKLGGVACFAAAVARLGWLAARRRVDVVHANMSTRGSAVRKCVLCCVATVWGVPAIMHMHGADLDQFYERLAAPWQAALRAGLRRCAFVVVLGEGWRRFLIERVRLDPARVIVLDNGVPDPPRRVRDPADPPTILFLGRLGARKGVPELLTALASATMVARRWEAVLAGDGEVERFRAMAQQLDLDDRVRFAGWVDRAGAGDLLDRAAMLVLPSHHEGMPMAILEALAHRVAVIATPVGANPEFLRDGDNALLAPPGDAAALAAAMVRLLDDAPLRATMAGAGRLLFEARFDIRLVANRLGALYETAIGDRP